MSQPMSLEDALKWLKEIQKFQQPHRELEGPINAIRLHLEKKHVHQRDTVYLLEALWRGGTILSVHHDHASAVKQARTLTNTSLFADDVDVDDDSWETWSELTDYEENIQIHHLELQ